MALTRCPVCDRLQVIEPTREPIADGFSATWWVIAQHLALAQDTGGLPCVGSGKRV